MESKTVRRITLPLLVVGALVAAGVAARQATARDTRHKFSVKEALETPTGQSSVNANVSLYFGKQSHPKVVQTVGEFTSNRKTNAANKSDKDACDRAFISALMSLQERALNEGGNAVINIKSYYKKHEVVSETEYECGAGNIVAGVTLKGTVVKVAK